MKKLATMLSALALFTFGAWAQDEVTPTETPVVEQTPADNGVTQEEDSTTEGTTNTTDNGVTQEEGSTTEGTTNTTEDNSSAEGNNPPAADEGQQKEASKSEQAPSTESVVTPVAAPAAQADSQEPDVLPVWEIIAFCVVVVGVIGLGIWKASDGNEKNESEEEKAPETMSK